MCGRFTLRSSPQAVAEAFALPEAPDLFPRFNIAPGQPVGHLADPDLAPVRELVREVNQISLAVFPPSDAHDDLPCSQSKKTRRLTRMIRSRTRRKDWPLDDASFRCPCAVSRYCTD